MSSSAGRRTIPVHDAAAPLACTITEAEVPGRIEQVERLRAALTKVERTADGLRLTWPAGPALRADVERFTVDEQRCCAFWRFAIDPEDADAVVLHWSGPPDAAPILDALHTYFSGDGPLTLDLSLL